MNRRNRVLLNPYSQRCGTQRKVRYALHQPLARIYAVHKCAWLNHNIFVIVNSRVAINGYFDNQLMHNLFLWLNGFKKAEFYL